MRRLHSKRAIGVAVAAIVLAACGTTGQNVPGGSPSTGTPTPAAGPSAASSPSPAAADVRLVIDDYSRSEVRLARLDATRTAVVKGRYVGIAGGQVIVLDGKTVQAVNPNGTVTNLGQLTATPEFVGLGTIVVNPQLSQWLYVTRDDASTTTIHLGAPTSDTVIATVPSPDGNAYYQPFTWNSSGAYMVREPIGLGGAGPFLEYRFPLAKFDLTTHRVTDVSPRCVAYQVLDDGTMICRSSNPGGSIEVRSPSGHSNLIQLARGGGASGDLYMSVVVSPDHKRMIAARNGVKDPVLNYQIAIADLTSSTANAFGPLDYLPDAWLPDGRVVADHRCAISEWGGGPCDASLDGTYIFSSDGASHTLFYKLASGVVVAYV